MVTPLNGANTNRFCISTVKLLNPHNSESISQMRINAKELTPMGVVKTRKEEVRQKEPHVILLKV